MNLGNLLSAGRIAVPLPAKTLHDAAEQLISLFAETGLTEDPSTVVERVTETPADEAITLDDVFILHLRSEAMLGAGVALGVTAEPVALEQASEKSARVVVVIAGPNDESAVLLQALSACARLFGKEELRERVASAKGREDVVGIEEVMDYEFPGSVLVGDIMSRRPRFLKPETSLSEAAHILNGLRLPAAPVITEQGEVLGMISMEELLREALPKYLKQVRRGEETENKESGDNKPKVIRDIMDRSVLCITEEQTLADVLSLMVNKKTDRFPVVRDGALVGLLTRAGVVRLLYGP
ncbi:MAG: CBS domain-containing protein [Gemmatimonadota bacterium]|nr:CBS domain-containing protein [Gemmatimonadota bacterium]